MKPDEIPHRKTINEVDWSKLIGNKGVAGMQALRGRSGGVSTEDRMAENIFIQDFVSKATQTLSSAIRGNLVDPAMTDAPAEKPATTPAPAPAPAPGTPYDPAKAQADRLAKGQADQQLAQQQMKATAASNATTNAADAQLKAASDAAKAKQGFQRTGADKRAMRDAQARGIKESKKHLKSTFSRLNSVFESIMLNEAVSIASHLKQWVTQYMRGVNISSPQDQELINKLIGNVQTTWGRDKGRAALTQLANTAYALSHTNKIGRGGGGGTAPSAAPSAAPAVSKDPATLIKSVSAALTQLKTVDPASYNTFMTTLKGGTPTK